MPLRSLAPYGPELSAPLPPSVENVYKVVEQANKLGGTSQGPVMDMFGGDGCDTVIDPDGYSRMVGTHKAQPAAKEMKKGMEGDDVQQPSGL